MSVGKNKVYLLDTNILFELSLWLPIDLNRRFWEKIEAALREGKWVLLDVVVEEVKYDNDGLKKWCEVQKGHNLVKNLEDVQRNRAVEINGKYPMIDETSQRSTVDTYLIAYAEAHGLTILSRERTRLTGADLYKIPDVCKILGIKTVRRPREFFEALGYKN